METADLTRRRFIQSAAAITSAAVLSPLGGNRAFAQTTRPSATDIVMLGKTGIKLSRLGIGTGVNNGGDQFVLGKENFNKLIRHAYDSGITYLDCAQEYQTFGWMGDAIKGIPRDKLFIMSKVWPREGQNVTEIIDAHRKNFNTDYIDSLLVHCRSEPDWTEQWKAMLDAFDQAKEKQWIKAKGVSCHSFPALEIAGASPWPDVHLIRINPQGLFMDGPNMAWSAAAKNPIQPVLDQIKAMHDKGRGVIGMKIFGNGAITDPAEREKSIRFAASNPHINAFVIGMTTPAQVDENLKMVNKVLAG